MTPTTPIRPLAACIFLALTSPLLAATAAVTDTSAATATEKAVAADKTAGVCRNDLRAFDAQMEKDGFWVGGGGFGLAYPMGAAGYGMYDGTDGSTEPAFAGQGYRDVRPGYEIRVLVGAANILARHGQQQACEDVLTQTHTLYQHYLTNTQRGGKQMADTPDWRTRQIHAAVSVADAKLAFRSDELLGVEVRSPKGVALGSVDDIVLGPKTGAIAYLVIARGGILGFDETRVPIPWDDFKAAPNASLLVLDTSKTVLDGAPQVKKDSFSVDGEVGGESQKVDAYWRTHQPPQASN